jgi:transposase, IS30 family
MHDLKICFEYRAAVAGEYREMDGPATGPEESPQTRLGGSAGSPPVEIRAADAQSMAMTTRRALNLSERIELQAWLRAGESQAEIARRLGRSAGAISGELRRNGGRDGYQAEMADRGARARRSAARYGRCHIEEHPPLRAEVHVRLRRGWSPEEVAGSLWRDNPDLPAMHTSHESIYRYVYVVARGELKRELVACLRRHHSARRPRRRGVASAQGQLKDMVLVDERPPEVETRLIPGHYEGDLIVGAGNRSAVGVLVERTTRYTFLCHLPQKDATSVREAFERKLAPLPGVLRQSLTYDQGKEMAEHQRLAANLQLKVFFCHAHSPWERATCESQNDRIRHYLPKGTDLSLVSYQQLRAYQEMLNERPRKILNWKSPAQCFQELLISNHRSN